MFYKQLLKQENVIDVSHSEILGKKTLNEKDIKKEIKEHKEQHRRLKIITSFLVVHDQSAEGGLVVHANLFE